jgi:hypothetical protein
MLYFHAGNDTPSAGHCVTSVNKYDNYPDIGGLKAVLPSGKKIRHEAGFEIKRDCHISNGEYHISVCLY